MGGPRGALLLGAALLFAGVAFASTSLLVPGAALVVLPLAVSAWAWLSAYGARIERSGLPPRVVEGARFELRLSIRAGLLPLVATLHEPALAEPLPIRRLRLRQRFEMTVEGALARRGRYDLGAPVLRLADPLGLVCEDIEGAAGATVLVLPRIEPVVAAGGGGGRSLGPLLDGFGELSRSAGRESPSEPDLDGLRPYRAGSPASRIYWPALARNDELLELRLTQPAGTGPLIALDPSCPRDPDALDRAVRAAASLCVHLARRGGCELLLPGSRQPIALDASMESWPRAHSALALVEAEAGPPDPAALHASASLFWVRAAPGAPSIAARGYVVVPDALPGKRVAFTVAGCSAHPLTAERDARPRLAVAR